MIDRLGDPTASQDYEDAVEALFSLSYSLKFMIKKTKAVDYAVMPLEGLWWVDDMSRFSAEDKYAWKWTSMIMQPGLVTEDSIAKAIEELEKQKKMPSLSKIPFESFYEDTSAQIMYVGSFSDEGSTIQKIHKFIRKN